MTKLDNFINNNYDLIINHYKEEGKDLGYEDHELNDYAEDCKGFTFCGTKDELEQETKDYYIIAQKDDLVIAETFGGTMYDFI